MENILFRYFSVIVQILFNKNQVKNHFSVVVKNIDNVASGKVYNIQIFVLFRQIFCTRRKQQNSLKNVFLLFLLFENMQGFKYSPKIMNFYHLRIIFYSRIRLYFLLISILVIFFDSNILILHYLKFSISLNCIQVMTERMQLFYEGVTGKGINMLDSV